ncbi:heavy metal sensor histidine kinase [[Erwinia] mediterraneensis]|uniref:heavy metal sensor histidine kinase n=1 Tax=[Erwinia] mediterraneensis TaxID=2161819 RepID=UPI001EEDC8A4|nr:heavy metal sensor histidine kinase [[Erwinia] mediterraneensis]
MPVTQINAMLGRLEQGFRQIKQVSADMAHDLRTPITTLLGQTEVAPGTPRDNAYYQRLPGSNYEELQRISCMIDNMLFLAQAEQPDQEIQRVRVDITEEIARVCDYFDDIALERNVTIKVSGGGTGWVDVLLFRRALANLLSNAVRYAEPESQIEVVAEPVREGIAVRVSNRGPTISPDDQQRIFDRFYRVDLSRKDSAHSCGLGLSIVSSIMQLHHGRCWVESSSGVTTFGLLFPPEKTDACSDQR